MRVVTSQLFSEQLRHGVFQTWDIKPLQDIKQIASTKGFVYVELNGLEVTNKNEFLSVFERELAAPIELNWDAFESELKSFSWIPEKGIVIIYRDFQIFQQADPKEFRILLSIIHSVVHLKMHQPSRKSQSLYFVFYSNSEVELSPVEISTPYLAHKS